MYEDTPNKEYIDSWLDDMRARYDFDRLKDMSIDRLHNMEFMIDSRFMIFKSTFPSQKSMMQGERRAVLSDDPNDTRQALTSLEKQRLRQAREDLKHEVYRAKGHRRKLIRQHRSDLVNSFVDGLNAVNRSVLGLWATVREATPW